MIDVSFDFFFYGIFVGNKLVVRMVLFDKGEVEEIYFFNSNDYIFFWKLEVLDMY